MADSLQTTGKYEVGTSTNWKPRDDIIVSSPATKEAAKKVCKKAMSA